MPRKYLAHHIKNPAGFALIEVILAVSLLALAILGSIGAILYGEESQVIAGTRTRATLVADETIDILRGLRNTSYDVLNEGTYGLDNSSGEWRIATNPTTEDGFTRSFTVESGGATGIKKVTTTVSWGESLFRGGSISVPFYLTKWDLPLDHPSSSGGGGGGGSSAPLLSTSGGGGPVSDDHYRLEVRPDSGASEDYVYSIDNRAGTISIFSVRDNGSINTAAGTILDGDLDFHTPTNIFVSHDFLYVVTNNLKQSMYIFSLEDPINPARVGVYNASAVTGSSSALSVYVTNDGAHDDVAYIGYVRARSGTLPDFIAVDVTDYANPTTLSSLFVDKSIGDIFVDSSHVAHTVVINSAGGLEYNSIDVSSVATEMTLLGSVGIPIYSNVTLDELLYRQLSISVSGTTVYVGGGKTTAVLDVTNPSSPILSDSVHDELSYYFALNWRSGYTFAVGAFQMSTFFPTSGVTIVSSNFFTDPSGVAVAYSSNLDFVYTIELSVFHVYTVD